MKSFQALGRALFLVLLLDGIQCRTLHVTVTNRRISTDGEYFVKEELSSAQDSGSNAKGEVTPENFRSVRGVSRSERRVAQHPEGKKIEVLHASSQGHQQYLTSADTRQKNVSATEGLNIEIIERPKELKVFVKKMPMKKQSPKGGVINKLKKLGEIINKVKLKSTDGANLNEDWNDENKIHGGDDDDDEISGRGQHESRNSFDFHDSGYKEILLSRDQAQHKPNRKDRHGPHQKQKLKDPSRTIDLGGGPGILLSMLVTIFVLSVISIVFLRRKCCLGEAPTAEFAELVKKKPNNKRLPFGESVHKEVRITVGKRKSQENRKVLRQLSTEQGANTLKDELAIACPIICPTMETRKKNSGALHTRACIRAATSHSRRDSSFEEDLLQAHCEFKNAPARHAKIVSISGEDKEIKATESSNEAVTTSESPVDSSHQ